jgi:hypothetical protein
MASALLECTGDKRQLFLPTGKVWSTGASLNGGTCEGGELARGVVLGCTCVMFWSPQTMFKLKVLDWALI